MQFESVSAYRGAPVLTAESLVSLLKGRMRELHLCHDVLCFREAIVLPHVIEIAGNGLLGSGRRGALQLEGEAATTFKPAILECDL